MITVYGENVTHEQLKTIELERPEGAGRSWKGIQHGELVDIIHDEMKFRGWELEKEMFSLSSDEADLAGAFQIKIPQIEQIEGQQYSLGFLTSNARRRALKMVVGTRVACCNNGMATGEIVLNLKHTKGVDICDEIDLAMDRYFNKAKEIPAIVASLRAAELAEEAASNILIDAGRKKLLPWSKIGKVDEEYHKPTYGEHGTGTSWALLNAFTHIVKAQNPMTQMDRMNRFREMLPREVGA